MLRRWRKRSSLSVPALSRMLYRLRNANSTCLNGSTLDRDLSERLARAVRIANDADCFALSEASDGAGAHASSVFGVILGTGTGGGIVIDKRLLTGVNAIAGEWGHNPLPWPREGEWPGPPCYCGKTGCVETFLSGTGLARDYREATGETIDGGPSMFDDPRIDVGGPTVNPTTRELPHNMIETRVPMIDVFNSLVESQKIPIFSVLCISLDNNADMNSTGWLAFSQAVQ